MSRYGIHILFFRAIAVAATLMVIVGLSAVHALLYLIVSLLAVAIVFYVLGAPFAAALEVIIYAGAIMVLFVFVMMMLNLGKAAAAKERDWLNPGMWTGPAVLAALLGGAALYPHADAATHRTAVVMRRRSVHPFGPIYWVLNWLHCCSVRMVGPSWDGTRPARGWGRHENG